MYGLLTNPIVALIGTIIIEFIVYLIAIRKNVWRLLLYATLINAFTNPLANFFTGLIFSFSLFLVIEFLVFIVEIFLIKYLLEIKYWKAVLISLIANLITSFAGFVFLYF